MMKKIENNSTLDLKVFLEKLENFSVGSNNQVSLSAAAYGVSVGDNLPLDLVSQLFPSIKAEEVKVKSVSVENMVNRVNESIPYIENKLGDFSPASGHSPNSQPVQPQFDYIKAAEEYWDMVSKCVDYKTAEVWEISLPSNVAHVFWYFYFVVYNPKQNICLFLTGGADD